MQLETGFSFNSIIWITSVPHTEENAVGRMVESMEVLSAEKGNGFQQIVVNSRGDLEAILKELTFHAINKKMKPLLHFDMHGNKDAGLYIDAENAFMSWGELADLLRELNTATQNNLCVVGAACFGLQAIKPISLLKPTPFFILLAPEEKTHLGFLEKNVPSFYRATLEDGGIDSAFEKFLSAEFKYFHCEKMLFIVLARYISQQCMGKGKQERVDRLLTEIFLAGKEKTPESLTETRKLLKSGIKPSQELVQKYTEPFLIGRKCSFDIEDLLEVIREKT